MRTDVAKMQQMCNVNIPYASVYSDYETVRWSESCHCSQKYSRKIANNKNVFEGDEH